MLKDLLAENNIRDQFYPIARRYIKEKSYRVLINKLVELINSFPENAGDVERLISTLKTKQDFDIYGFFAKWYPNQPDEFHKAIEQLFLNEDLIKMFHIALSEWANNLTLNFSQSRSKIRELYLAEIYHGIGDIRIPVGTIHEESHHSNHADMAYVCAIAAFIKAVNIFEFGTYRGQTTCSLAGTGDNTRVYTLNLPPEYDPRYAPYIGKFIQKSPFKQRIIQLFDDSLKFDTSPYAKKMDYIFIDADHSYEYVKNDTEKALDMLRPGGVIVWHDYAAKSPGVYKFIQEFSCKRPVFRIRNTCLIAYLDGVDALTFSPAVIPDSLENEVSERDRFKTN
ncbi:MAG: class I SAM-dependent methyltransferase [Nitrospirae bacterium]|nr:class I SAM-dependent methyltransferase [Nitrospirota bacterium]